ncbi:MULTISPECIES: hypothetical protein [Paenibacillus]|uniref:hypothetical protein n=1 Tax=Paenibacillus TaxID=44249 RepID=UPI000E3D7633|nr:MULTISPECIES: hypothetical protein [Paenibacillus]QDA25897.1 hypothetical protein FGY93_02395 [Paenibacillus polymyxa]RFU00250.1 hypothetical protein DX902_01430 [Paenibacillus jamilae]RTZ36638.1 hypothetical protein EJ573_07250 [Paenibacillus polymyxa]
MASEKTPNLGLNQIDRTSPITTYFDLEKYLDENWRSVDKFAGDVNDGVNEIKKRLDTTERKAVALEPGVQIVHAEKAAPFSLTGLSGRTLVNLLGRMGSCETVSDWSSNVAIAIDNNNKANGSSSFKITLGSVPATASASFLTTPGRKYIAIADVKSGNTSNVEISINGIASAVGNDVNSGSVFAPSVVRFTAKEYFHIVTITGTGATGNIFNMDSVRVYEISDADYAAAASLTPVQAAAKYTYVDSVMPVRNPYAIRYGENLIPPFYEWTRGDRAKVINPYKLETVATVSVDQSNVYVPVAPGTPYTLTVKVNGRVTVVEVDDVGGESTVYSTTDNENRVVTVTFTTKTTTKRVRVYATNTGAGTFTLENPMLNIGSTAKPFKPREDSMLALQTDLYADPVTGANPDMVFERDGQYFKSKKWQGLMLDGNQAWVYKDTKAGNKQVTLPLPNPKTDSERVTKYDGKLIAHAYPWTDSDQSFLAADGLYLSIPVADSGWADGYQPSQDDIKAYFYGFKVYDAGTFTPANAQAATTATWNGTGAKYYVPRVGPANPVASVPQQSYVGYTPYQLVYQLATPIVEPIVSEGQLSFVEGDNQVELGTGIVLRESVGPKLHTNGFYYINANAVSGSNTVNTPSRIINIFANNRKDTSSWANYTNSSSNGITSELNPSKFNAAASYSITYLMSNPSPAVPFAGSYAANEKTLLSDLVDSIQQNTARVSVLENKKADKDNPAWLTPTLLNGWVVSRPVGIMKDSNGFVHIRGLVVNGLTNGGLTLFTLPQGYRPTNIQGPVSYGYGVNGPVLVQFDIFPDGRVCFGGGGAKDSTSLSLLFPPFLAEQ